MSKVTNSSQLRKAELSPNTKERVEKFFDYLSAADVKDDLWKITVAAMGNDEFATTGMERQHYLCVYQELCLLIDGLEQELHLNQKAL